MKRPRNSGLPQLSRRDEQIILALLEHPTQEKAAAAVGISKTTLWRVGGHDSYFYTKTDRVEESNVWKPVDAPDFCFSRRKSCRKKSGVCLRVSASLCATPSSIMNFTRGAARLYSSWIVG